MKTLLTYIFAAASILAQSSEVPGNRTFTGIVDMSASTTQKDRQGLSLPATCVAGEKFTLLSTTPYTTGPFYQQQCTSTNNWTSGFWLNNAGVPRSGGGFIYSTLGSSLTKPSPPPSNTGTNSALNVLNISGGTAGIDPHLVRAEHVVEELNSTDTTNANTFQGLYVEALTNVNTATNLTGVSDAGGLSAALFQVSHYGSGTISRTGGVDSSIVIESTAGPVLDVIGYNARPLDNLSSPLVPVPTFKAFKAETTNTSGSIGTRYGFYDAGVNPAACTVTCWSFYSVSGLNWFGGGIAQPLVTPSSSTAACTTGQIEFDAAFIYTCVATNTWRRAATSSF